MTAIATLVERSTRFVMLMALPQGHKSEQVVQALAASIQTLPRQLTRSLTWDQGHEMALHAKFTVATGVAVYFCDPNSPWQRGSNENTYWCRVSRAGLLRRETLRSGRWVTRRTRAERPSVDLSTAAHRAGALTGSDLIEAC
jgi:IS30 family transposase